METLKISDLSVGDWVKMDGEHFQIYHLTLAGEAYGYRRVNTISREEYFDGSIADVYPIPITAEILEKNGWKLSKSNWFEFEDGEWKINIWIGKSKCNIEISQKREIYTSTYADIQVVKSNINTLQHALRLAGVEKEINL